MSGRWWLAAVLLSLHGVSNAAFADEPRWLSDLEEGRKEARTSGKPLFVVFRCQH